MSVDQFYLMYKLGLRQDHRLLDLGCGSLRAGRFFIPYLLPGRYFGIEPEEWAVKAGIDFEVGDSLVKLRMPQFYHGSDFNLETFKVKFDYIVAQSIFSHAAASQISDCLSSVNKVLNPKGVMAFSYARGGINYDGDTWTYPGTVHYTEEFMKDLIGRANLSFIPIEWTHHSLRWAVITTPSNERDVIDLVKKEGIQQ
jgi:SAM-dependent methyltransferase